MEAQLGINQRLIKQRVLSFNLDANGLSELERSLMDMQTGSSMNKILFHNIYFCICEACSLLTKIQNGTAKNSSIRICFLQYCEDIIVNLYGSDPLCVNRSCFDGKSKGSLCKDGVRNLSTIKHLADSHRICTTTGKISIAFKI